MGKQWQLENQQNQHTTETNPQRAQLLELSDRL